MGGQVRNSVGASVFLLSFCLFFLVAIKVPAFKDWRKSFVVVPNSSYKRRVSRFIMSFPGGWIWKYYEIDKFSVLNSNLPLSLSCLTLLVLGDFLLIFHISYFIFNSFKEGCPSTSWFSRGPPIKTLVTI